MNSGLTVYHSCINDFFERTSVENGQINFDSVVEKKDFHFFKFEIAKRTNDKAFSVEHCPNFEELIFTFVLHL